MATSGYSIFKTPRNRNRILLSSFFLCLLFFFQNTAELSGQTTFSFESQNDTEMSVHHTSYLSSYIAERIRDIINSTIPMTSRSYTVSISARPYNDPDSEIKHIIYAQRKEMLLSVPGNLDLWTTLDPEKLYTVTAWMIFARLGSVSRDASELRNHWIVHAIARKAMEGTSFNSRVIFKADPAIYALTAQGFFPTLRQSVSCFHFSQFKHLAAAADEYAFQLLEICASEFSGDKKFFEQILLQTLASPHQDQARLLLACFRRSGGDKILLKQAELLSTPVQGKTLPENYLSTLSEEKLETLFNHWYQGKIQDHMLSIFIPASPALTLQQYENLRKVSFITAEGIEQSCFLHELPFQCADPGLRIRLLNRAQQKTRKLLETSHALTTESLGRICSALQLEVDAARMEQRFYGEDSTGNNSISDDSVSMDPSSCTSPPDGQPLPAKQSIVRAGTPEIVVPDSTQAQKQAYKISPSSEEPSNHSITAYDVRTLNLNASETLLLAETQLRQSVSNAEKLDQYLAEAEKRHTTPGNRFEHTLEAIEFYPDPAEEIFPGMKETLDRYDFFAKGDARQ